MRFKTIKKIIFIPLLHIAATCQSMSLYVIDNTMVLSGDVVAQDLDNVKNAFAANPKIKTVILRNSKGGNSWTGYRLGELFREKAVSTAVSGHCVSACSRLFLGGSTRTFTNDFPASLTYVGFHGHYDFGKLNLKAVDKDGLRPWLIKYSGGKIDPALMERWINLPSRDGDARFYPPSVKQSTVLCRGNESRRPQQCEALTANALSQGIVTSIQMTSSPDAHLLPYKRRERQYPTTAYAALNSISAFPIKSPHAEKDYSLFLNAALPRAIAVSANQKTWAWNGNSTNSAATALSRCAAQAKQTCTLYAVDERVVYAPVK